jgi:hypothetical protein
MPNLTQLLPENEARDFELGAKRNPFEWYDVNIVTNVEAVSREINILKLLASERQWEMPGWDDIEVSDFVNYFNYLVSVRIASVWSDQFPGSGVWIPPSIGTRKSLPMPATWLAYLEAIGVVYNRTENYGLRPVLEGASRPENGRPVRLGELALHQRVVNYLYTLEAKRIIPIIRGLPRDMEGVSHVMHMQYVDDYFKSHQADSTPNAAWVAAYLVRNRLERFQPFVKYFTAEEHLDHVDRIATREYRTMNRQSQSGNQPRQKPKPNSDEGGPPIMSTPTATTVTDHAPTASVNSDPAATQE